MNNVKGFSGVSTAINATPLINFDTMIDTDVSLIAYIIKYVRNEKYFDLEKLHHYDLIQIIKEIYLRNYRNPLYFLMKDDKDKEFLDKCYEEFNETEEFLDYFKIATDFYQVVLDYINSGEVVPTILCKSEKQIAVIKDENALRKARTILPAELDSKEFNKHGQFYVKYIEDLDDYMRFLPHGKSFYISSVGLNRVDSGDNIIQTDTIESLLSYRLNHVNILDLYKAQIARRSE